MSTTDSELFTLFSTFTEYPSSEDSKLAKKFAQLYLRDFPQLFNQILNELREVVSEGRIPEEEIKKAGFQFTSEEVGMEWLKEILSILEEEKKHFEEI